MRKEFVIRGMLTHGVSEVLNFSGYKPGYAYRLTEFSVWPSGNVHGATDELAASITAEKTAADPINPDFNQEGLIGNAMYINSANNTDGPGLASLVNDTFLITQNLLILARDESGGNDINYQARFVSEKMSGPEEAVANYKQYTISDE